MSPVQLGRSLDYKQPHWIFIGIPFLHKILLWGNNPKEIALTCCCFEVPAEIFETEFDASSAQRMVGYARPIFGTLYCSHECKVSHLALEICIDEKINTS